MTDRKVNLITEIDHRDLPIAPLLTLAESPSITKKFWWDNGWWGNQGSTEECTAYSWTHWVEDTMLNDKLFEQLKKPLWNMDDFYHKLQKNDGIPGIGYQGSTVRAGAKVLKEMNVIEEYRWASTVDEIAQCILTIAPMVVGTTWFMDMFKPDRRYHVHAEGSSAGGHAYVLNGVDTDQKIFRIKNSWGKDWGDGGHAYISFDDFDKLLKMGGQACIAVREKLSIAPNINSVIDVDQA